MSEKVTISASAQSDSPDSLGALSNRISKVQTLALDEHCDEFDLIHQLLQARLSAIDGI